MEQQLTKKALKNSPLSVIEQDQEVNLKAGIINMKEY